MEATIITKSMTTAYAVYTGIEVNGREFVRVTAELSWRDDSTLEPATVGWSSVGDVGGYDAAVYAQALVIAAGVAAGYDTNRAAIVELIRAERGRLEAAKAAREAKNAKD